MVAVLIGSVCFGFICSRVISGMKSSGKKNLDYVVVLGAHVKGDVPSKALELRLKAALKYARENEDTTLILSGGQGFGEDITEAKWMENYLTAHGISQERLVLEEKSTSTKENLKFSDELTGCSKKNTGILSNNFHVYRAVKLAKSWDKTSLWNCGGIRSYYAGALCGAGSSSTCKRKTSGKYLIFYHLYFADY